MKPMLAVVIFVAASCLSLCTASLNAAEPPRGLPESLRVPPGHAVLLRASAVGAQIYTCQATLAGYEWVFQAPEAGLFSGQVQLIGTHYAGPTWQAPDGSRVVGARVEAADAPNPASIPWLLLRATAHEGSGPFSEVTYIQRVLTGGGVAPPAQSCDAAHVGEEARVDYIAVYYFYVEAQAPALVAQR